MLERIEGLPAGIEGLDARGKVTADDYVAVVEPLFDAARREGRKLRLLYQFGPDFEGFGVGAAWKDMSLGLRNLRRLERVAVVTDKAWIHDGTKLLGALLPSPVKVFGGKERSDAVLWLETTKSSTTVPHRLLGEAGVLVVEPERALSVEDFDALALTVDPWLEAHGKLHGIVIRAKKFPGWKTPGGLLRHFQFVRDHQRKVERIALVTDSEIGEWVPKLAEHFVAAEVRHFGFDQLEEGLEWARAE